MSCETTCEFEQANDRPAEADGGRATERFGHGNQLPCRAPSSPASSTEALVLDPPAIVPAMTVREVSPRGEQMLRMTFRAYCLDAQPGDPTSMGTDGLRRALAAGAPLIEVVVRFRPGIDFAGATSQLNSLADDFDLYPDDGYGDPAVRVGSATSAALERLFGWRIVRVPLERYLEATGEWSVWPDTFRWEELNSPQRMPPAAAQLIDSISITQPGADDEGQPWPWPAPDPVARR